jgi:hypothetical protein
MSICSHLIQKREMNFWVTDPKIFSFMTKMSFQIFEWNPYNHYGTQSDARTTKYTSVCMQTGIAVLPLVLWQ